MDRTNYILLKRKDWVFVVFAIIVLSLVFFVKRADYLMKIEIRNKAVEQTEKILELQREIQVEQHVQEDQEQVFLDSIDVESDDSLHKFVNNMISFTDVSYIPAEMETFSSDFIMDTKGNGLIRMEANIELQKLAEAFYNEFGVPLKVVSSYRSYLYQKGIKDRGCPDNLCAKAGFSEHQSGLSVDIFSASNEYTWVSDTTLSSYFKWMQLNAADYGFTNTYQKGLFVDGYDIEPWHWRFIGSELANYLQDNKLTIAEFYLNRQK